MKEMTDEEAEYWDDYYTKNPPKIDPAKNGGFAKKSFRMVALDSLSADYLMTRAMATHKTTTEIIGELVRKEITAQAPAYTPPAPFVGISHR
jgi:hypothetical protein